MLAGEGAIAIWNGIADEGRADFYAWHLHEHMPERVGTPGFVRGRRYRAINSTTHPEFFTLYETVSFEVTRGMDYLSRLNSPTPWTRSTTSHFRNTVRSLTRVAASFGVGPGGVLLTVRFDVPEENAGEMQRKLQASLQDVADLPMVTGAHLLLGDAGASGITTAESKDRRDIEQPARWIILVEACLVEALESAMAHLQCVCLIPPSTVGTYAVEYTRLKTAFSVG